MNKGMNEWVKQWMNILSLCSPLAPCSDSHKSILPFRAPIPFLEPLLLTSPWAPTTVEEESSVTSFSDLRGPNCKVLLLVHFRKDSELWKPLLQFIPCWNLSSVPILQNYSQSFINLSSQLTGTVKCSITEAMRQETSRSKTRRMGQWICPEGPW